MKQHKKTISLLFSDTNTAAQPILMQERCPVHSTSVPPIHLGKHRRSHETQGRLVSLYCTLNNCIMQSNGALIIKKLGVLCTELSGILLKIFIESYIFFAK